ncbi:hypothetical protein N7476_009019 [Penicillium atrosanguineum]|uniref:WKF domain-containing protein n=1 Tax=Penicillium atrosanguineum TaxID=1132637 RepID=A0A9W9PVN1_9EURO|nr:hypothetical protein N7526_002233 [Penicillium atrosanguineum]KAJ5308363.1 hypothetical protein N7476_009019 [Penicillium atrosanguineum]
MAKDTAVASTKKSSNDKHSKDTDETHDDQPMTDVKSKSKDKKKRKKSSEDDESTKKKKRRHDSDDDTTEKKKKKRVSFGPGTKIEDGSGDETSETVTGEEEAEAEPTETKSDEAAEAEAALEEMRKRKREKKKERKTGAAPSTAQIHETPILSYLNRYYKDRESWKFQKNRETNIFKHMYSLEHVPAPFNAALLAYMQGLKGDMAKMRLSQGAATVLKADTEQAADADFEKAIEEFRSTLLKGGDVNETEDVSGDVQKRLQRRQRAELVFFAVTGKLFTNEEMKEQQRAAAKERAKEAAKLKKRKNRTAIVISSSESEDTSDDDSGSSDDEEKKTPVAKAKSVAKPTPADASDATSSSGSSDSSSSDSDGDDEAPAPKKPAAKATKAPKAKKVKPAKPAKVEEVEPSKNKKKQKRKQRTVNIEISSSESDSD